MWGSNGHGFTAVQEAAEQHIGGWNPDQAQDIEDFFAGLPDFLENLGSVFHHLSDRMGSELPIMAPVRELVAEVGGAVQLTAEHARDTYNAHRTEHEGRLDRLENPMPGEETWNV